MKKVFVTLVCLMMLSTVAMASPLMDYNQGKVSVDLTWRNTQNSLDDFSFDKKYNLDAALTVGLGNKWAFQYRNFEPKSGATGTDQETLKLATNEFNAMYKLDKNFAAFAGFVTGKATFEDNTGFNESASRNMWQFGLVASTEIAPKTTLWGSVAAGNHSWTNWEAGVGYELAPNLELNVSYREMKANVSDTDFKAKGLGYGITYKF